MSDFIFPEKWAIASKNPFPASPLQVANDATFTSGYSQPVKLPGLTTASGTTIAAAGVALNRTDVTAHTEPTKWPWW